MDSDVDLMRDLLLLLEERQLSPRNTIVLSIDEHADLLNRTPEAVGASLDRLLELDYIDGPGRDDDAYWLFRKLTRKGQQFVNEARTAAGWARLKLRYSG